ncbi:alpha 1,2 mannosyltransferase [Maudiozyma exigua]|uniref:Mannosyltransferase n=1 Tax=Maudiozyma exigua TaxID=34358 RepID=A0A9P6WAQ5_MAUEX|nr:alpha 1,2 mannosyltransferase [Kazachstania exigua]
MTFPAFILLPSLKLFYKYYLKHLKCFICLLATIGVSSTACIYVDTRIYGSNDLVVAPWNNLLYNMSVSNLSKHGLHPRYTHILINIPQLIGPASICLMPYIKNDFKGWFTKLPNLSICSALIMLSIFPHQELRFLIPIVPFICMQLPNIHSRWFFKLWMVFNTILFIIMGVFHEAGIIDTLVSQRYFAQKNINVHIWWKTYSPPTWMYMNKNLTVSTTNFINDTERIDNIDFDIDVNHVIDLKGCDTELANDTITEFFNRNPETIITLLYPASVQTKVLEILNRTDINYTSKYYTPAHLDLDHFDIDDTSTFMPGFNVIDISYI